jgi:hypothetical protein
LMARCGSRTGSIHWAEPPFLAALAVMVARSTGLSSVLVL